MKLSKSTKNIVLWWLMLLWATGSMKKSIDHTSNKQYNNIKSITPYEDLDGKVFDNTPLVSAELTKILEKDLSDTQREQYANQADNEYNKIVFHYHNIRQIQKHCKSWHNYVIQTWCMQEILHLQDWKNTISTQGSFEMLSVRVLYGLSYALWIRDLLRCDDYFDKKKSIHG